VDELITLLETVTPEELIFLILSIFGVTIMVTNEVLALRMASWLARSRLNGPRRITVYGGVIRNLLLLLVQMIFLVIVILALTLPPRPFHADDPLRPWYEVFIPSGIIAAQFLLVIASELSRRERNALLRAIDHEEEHILENQTIPIGEGASVVSSMATVAKQIAAAGSPPDRGSNMSAGQRPGEQMAEPG
jgi:predicted membrane protein